MACRATAMAAVAAAQARFGDLPAARMTALGLSGTAASAEALSIVALALVDAKDLAGARAMANAALILIGDAKVFSGHLVSWALARSGDFAGALTLATRLDRNSAWGSSDGDDALAMVAYEQARAGNRAAAVATVMAQLQRVPVR